MPMYLATAAYIKIGTLLEWKKVQTAHTTRSSDAGDQADKEPQSVHTHADPACTPRTVEETRPNSTKTKNTNVTEPEPAELNGIHKNMGIVGCPASKVTNHTRKLKPKPPTAESHHQDKPRLLKGTVNTEKELENILLSTFRLQSDSKSSARVQADVPWTERSRNVENQATNNRADDRSLIILGVPEIDDASDKTARISHDVLQWKFLSIKEKSSESSSEKQSRNDTPKSSVPFERPVTEKNSAEYSLLYVCCQWTWTGRKDMPAKFPLDDQMLCKESPAATSSCPGYLKLFDLINMRLGIDARTCRISQRNEISPSKNYIAKASLKIPNLCEIENGVGSLKIPNPCEIVNGVGDKAANIGHYVCCQWTWTGRKDMPLTMMNVTAIY
ncbi:hypothetical protein T265_15538, partial [Opisthorchis viverrini]